MKLTFNLASKFLFGKKSKGIINIISIISIVGVAIGTIALIIVLSVFNGLDGLIGGLYGNFDPDLKIELKEGKFFEAQDVQIEKIREIDGVKSISPVVEENALLKYKKRQVTGVIMGVDSTYKNTTKIDSIIYEGKYLLKQNDEHCGVIGFDLADQLGVRTNFVTPVVIYMPDRNKKINLLQPNRSFNSEYVSTKGVFFVKQVEYDSKYLIIDLDLARKLVELDSNEVSYIAIAINDYTKVDAIQKKIQTIFGENYEVLNKQQQHENFYRMMRIEKIMAYLILCFILVIATFNLIGTMSMLIFDKRQSIRILKSMGANCKLTTNVFMLEGLLITIIGVIAGLIIGSILILIQQYFGVIGFGGSNFVVDAYPVKLVIGDLFISFLTVCVIGYLAILYPAKVIVKKYYNSME